MNIHQNLDSTYLKTAKQAGITEDETLAMVNQLVSEAIENNFKSVMIRPSFVKLAKEQITQNRSKVLVGTVIGFHEGDYPFTDKLFEAKTAIEHGADELDVVINYPAFLKGDVESIKEEIVKLTKLALENNKTIKWIIEVAALSENEIKKICLLIKNLVLENFDSINVGQVFVKSSTGFYQTKDNQPNGATERSIELMIKYSSPLPVKAAGGIKSYQDAIKMINLGVLRIGTSSANSIAKGDQTDNSY
ncbi:MAG: deoxyribose-phosphate aldolase [Flavobacteriaceae bacterium]|nr:deoxyribose-phosphate aldolase [Flavobacteriaceae bacterium]